ARGRVARLAPVVKLANVAAGAECLFAGPAHDHGRYRRVIRPGDELRMHQRDHIGIERIESLGPVERDDPDAPTRLEKDFCFHAHRSTLLAASLAHISGKPRRWNLKFRTTALPRICVYVALRRKPARGRMAAIMTRLDKPKLTP